MTTPQPAALPENELRALYQRHELATTGLVLSDFKRIVSDVLAALQSQPAAAGVSDAEIVNVFLADHDDGSADSAVRIGRAILALRPQAESEAPTVEAAREMGAKGGPVVEAERLAFEAWMAGHCWKVSPTWNGEIYDDSEEDKKRKLLDPLARTTRMLWAAWRDRAALKTRPQAVPMTDERLAEVLTTAYGSPEWAMDDVRAARVVEAAVLGITAQGAQGGEG